MCRILLQTVLLLGIALAAGWAHSRLIPPLQTKLQTADATTAPVTPKPEAPKPPTPPLPPAGNTGSTGSSGASGPTGTNPKVEPAPEGVTFITVSQAKEIFDKNDAIFVDARTFPEYTEGHVPNAMHMDKKYFDGAAGAVKSAKNLKGQAVVIYCHGAECTDSQAVASRFISLNYHIGPIKIIKEGFPGWVAAGYPVDKGPEVGW